MGNVATTETPVASTINGISTSSSNVNVTNGAAPPTLLTAGPTRMAEMAKVEVAEDPETGCVLDLVCQRIDSQDVDKVTPRGTRYYERYSTWQVAGQGTAPAHVLHVYVILEDQLTASNGATRVVPLLDTAGGQTEVVAILNAEPLAQLDMEAIATACRESASPVDAIRQLEATILARAVSALSKQTAPTTPSTEQQ